MPPISYPSVSIQKCFNRIEHSYLPIGDIKNKNSHGRSEIFIHGMCINEDFVVGIKLSIHSLLLPKLNFCANVVEFLACATMGTHILIIFYF